MVQFNSPNNASVDSVAAPATARFYRWALRGRQALVNISAFGDDGQSYWHPKRVRYSFELVGHSRGTSNIQRADDADEVVQFSDRDISPARFYTINEALFDDDEHFAAYGGDSVMRLSGKARRLPANPSPVEYEELSPSPP